jgi:hypothetical protein
MSLRRTDLKTRIALLTAVGALAAAPAAAAEEGEAVVPPDNSAVNQYTETFPTGGGERDVHKGRREQASPKQVLGDRNAEKLERHGPEGRAVAEVAAETAPTVDRSPSEPAKDDSDGEATATVGGGGGNGQGGGGNANGDARPQPSGQGNASAPPARDPSVDVPGGSSGVSEVLAQATGSTSSGDLGLLLPLVIVAAFCWALAVLLRRPRRAAG